MTLPRTSCTWPRTMMESVSLSPCTPQVAAQLKTINNSTRRVLNRVVQPDRHARRERPLSKRAIHTRQDVSSLSRSARSPCTPQAAAQLGAIHRRLDLHYYGYYYLRRHPRRHRHHWDHQPSSFVHAASHRQRSPLLSGCLLLAADLESRRRGRGRRRPVPSKAGTSPRALVACTPCVALQVRAVCRRSSSAAT